MSGNVGLNIFSVTLGLLLRGVVDDLSLSSTFVEKRAATVSSLPFGVLRRSTFRAGWRFVSGVAFRRVEERSISENVNENKRSCFRFFLFLCRALDADSSFFLYNLTNFHMIARRIRAVFSRGARSSKIYRWYGWKGSRKYRYIIVDE